VGPFGETSMVIDNIYPRLAMLCGSELELKLKPLGELAFLHFKSDQSAASLSSLLMLTTHFRVKVELNVHMCPV
jgi:hypothetical protein